MGVMTYFENIRLSASDFNAKTLATYNAQKELKGEGAISITGCGQRADGRLDHIGIDDWPVSVDHS